jgi:hypothetical protein
MTMKAPIGPLAIPGGGIVSSYKGAAPPPQGRPEIRDYPVDDEFIARTIVKENVQTPLESVLFTTDRPHGAIDVYLQGGGNGQGLPGDYFLYAINGGVRALVARARLYGADYGGTPPRNPFEQATVAAGPIYLMGARVVAERYECTFRTSDPVLVAALGPMVISAYATKFLPATPAFAGAYYPFRDGVSGERKGSTSSPVENFGSGRQVLLAHGVSRVAARRFFQIWDSNLALPVTGLVWTVDIPANESFHFELPADVAAAGLALRIGCTVCISTSPDSFVTAGPFDVRWNAILR